MTLEPSIRNVILCGDLRQKLHELPDESVHCVVTSPPYWSLRDYGVDPTVWGGNPECEHLWQGIMRQDERYTGKKKWQHLANGRGEFQTEVANALGRDSDSKPGYRTGRRLTVRDIDPNAWGHPQVEDTSLCAHCCAWRGALGLEPTPELYVEHLVAVMRRVRRVLRKDGTLWLNLGDSYSSGPGMNGDGSTGEAGETPPTNVGSNLDFHDTVVRAGVTSRYWAQPPPGLKPKDLVGMPWKPNPMP